MMKIINGKRYNTATAEVLCFHGNNLSKSDFNCIDMQLYRTKKGAYFVAGWGGAATRYSVKCGDMRSGADGVHPVSNSEARCILENADDAEHIEKYFTVVDA